jgi:hypothetical protein
VFDIYVFFDVEIIEAFELCNYVCFYAIDVIYGID